jgi:hypothetical protein
LEATRPLGLWTIEKPVLRRKQVILRIVRLTTCTVPGVAEVHEMIETEASQSWRGLWFPDDRTTKWYRSSETTNEGLIVAHPRYCEPQTPKEKKT